MYSFLFLTACSGGSDVVFAILTGNNKNLNYVQELTTFLGTVIGSMDLDSSLNGSTITRIGLVTYSTTATIQFNLGTYSQKSDVLQAINVPYIGGSDNLASAIKYVVFVINLKHAWFTPK